METWRDIPGYEGSYQVSDMGRVRSLPRLVPHGASYSRLKGRVLKPAPNRHGYQHLVLRKDGRNHDHEVHVLVASAFLGPRPDGDIQVRHLDGNRSNNTLTNLLYGTRSENQLDLYDYRGYHHKLTKADVVEIREKLSVGRSGRSLAEEYGCSESNISAIKKGATYAWLT